MANNLKKFATAADYSAATLNYPAVSWIVSGDTVEYDLSGSTPTPTVHDKFVKTEVYTGNNASVEVTLPYNYEGYQQTVSSITVNGVSVEVPTNFGQTYTISNISTNSVVTIEVGIEGTDFDLDSNGLDTMGIGESNNPEYLLPAQFTTIIGDTHGEEPKFVLLATTPPQLNASSSSFRISAFYVPDESVNAYKNDTTTGGEETWSSLAEKIFPISDYQGNLPV